MKFIFEGNRSRESVERRLTELAKIFGLLIGIAYSQENQERKKAYKDQKLFYDDWERWVDFLYQESSTSNSQKMSTTTSARSARSPCATVGRSANGPRP